MGFKSDIETFAYGMRDASQLLRSQKAGIDDNIWSSTEIQSGKSTTIF